MDYQKAKERLREHVTDTTGLLVEATPVGAILELASGMSVETSINSRFIIAGLNYLGLGYAFTRGRDFSRNAFGIYPGSPEGKRVVHDALYTGAFAVAICPPLYVASQTLAGESLDWYKIGLTTGVSFIVSLPMEVL